MTDWITIHHPNLDQQATVARSSLRQHEKAGWVEHQPDQTSNNDQPATPNEKDEA